jgi:carotenoid cleavage dioxygenase
MEMTRPTPESAGVAQGSCNTSVTVVGGELIAWGEGQSTPILVDPVTLGTKGFPEWATLLPDSMTPKTGPEGFGGGHPRVCPTSGQILFTSLHVDPPYVTVHVLHPGGGLDSFPVDSPFPSYIHDFMITADHAVLVVSPITMSQRRVISGGGLMAWEPELGTHVAVVARDGGGTVWVEADDNFYDLHPQNAFADGDRVVLDAPEFPIAPVPMEGVDPWKQFDGLRSHLVRYEIDLARRTLRRVQQDDRNYELPQCDRRFQGLPYRYGYGLCNDADLDDYDFNSVIRYDFRTAAPTVHAFGEHDSLCEPIFVPRSSGCPEGDGYLVTFVYHPDVHRSDAVILDALRLEDEPVATLALPHRVPFTAHGWWAEGIV